MKLSGAQVKLLHAAILNGYTPDSLRMIMRMELNESLYNVAGGTNFSEQVFTLIEWAESHGRVADLIRGTTPATLKT